MSSFLLPVPSELGPLLAPLGCGDWAKPLTCGVHFVKLRILLSETRPYIYTWTSHWSSDSAEGHGWG